MKTTLIYIALLVAGIWLLDGDWLATLGGLLIFIAGGIVGEQSAKEKNKISDHLRSMTKR